MLRVTLLAIALPLLARPAPAQTPRPGPPAIALQKVVAAPDTAWLSVGAGAGISDDLGPFGLAAVDVALRRLPVSIGARYEYAAREVVIVELGVGLRSY